MNPPDAEATYLLIDGENIDATLGLSVLDRRPTPDERPRWDRIREATEQLWHQQVRGLFYLNGTSSAPCDGLPRSSPSGSRRYEGR